MIEIKNTIDSIFDENIITINEKLDTIEFIKTALKKKYEIICNQDTITLVNKKNKISNNVSIEEYNKYMLCGKQYFENLNNMHSTHKKINTIHHEIYVLDKNIKLMKLQTKNNENEQNYNVTKLKIKKKQLKNDIDKLGLLMVSNYDSCQNMTG